jgi:Protein of unknown function (DUF2924)
MPRARIAAEAAETSSVEAEIARLRGLDAKVLRARWRTSFGQDAPPHVARHLLFAMLAYRLQAEAIGDLDAETVRFLKQVDLAPSKQAAVPLTEAFERRTRDLSPGTVLTREWGGQHHRVIVRDGGFAFGRGGLTAACQKLPSSSPGPNGTAPGSLVCATGRMRRSLHDGSRKAYALCDLHARVDRLGA